MDSRGHGRSTRNAQPFGYDLMAGDVIGLLDHLKIRKAALVGWSDGAIIGLDIAMHHPERLSKLFAFAANIDPSGVSDIQHSPTFTAYIARAGREYAKLSPTPKEYAKFVAAITHHVEHPAALEENRFRADRGPDLDRRRRPRRGHHHDQPRTMADWTPGAGLLIEPDVSHFAFLQDPAQFNRDLAHFLEKR